MLLFCVALSVDSLSVGVSFGLRKVSVSIICKIIISLMTALLTYLSMSLGAVLKGFVSEAAAGALSAAILCAVGVFSILRSLGVLKQKREKNNRSFEFRVKFWGLTIQVIRDPESCDFDNSNTISPFEALFLSIALSVDSTAAGIGAGISDFSPLGVSVTVALLSLLLLSLGQFLGGRLIRLENSFTLKLLPGMLIILTGLIKLF